MLARGARCVREAQSSSSVELLVRQLSHRLASTSSASQAVSEAVLATEAIAADAVPARSQLQALRQKLAAGRNLASQRPAAQRGGSEVIVLSSEGVQSSISLYM